MLKICLTLMTLLALNYSALLSAQTAPDLTLKGLDGKLHSMHKYIGKDKWVVVNIWGPKCPPCIEEMPELQSFHDKHKDKAAIVLGIALDFPSFGPANEKEVHQFVEDYFISFPVLLGDAQSIDFLGGGSLKGTPTTLLFSPSGNLEASHVGSITQKIIENFIAKSK